VNYVSTAEYVLLTNPTNSGSKNPITTDGQLERERGSVLYYWRLKYATLLYLLGTRESFSFPEATVNTLELLKNERARNKFLNLNDAATEQLLAANGELWPESEAASGGYYISSALPMQIEFLANKTGFVNKELFNFGPLV
jgi:hypothetical protein